MSDDDIYYDDGLIRLNTINLGINKIKLCDIVGILLANWQDNVNGESKAIELLR
jgi:hypothetical protein